MEVAPIVLRDGTHAHLSSEREFYRSVVLAHTPLASDVVGEVLGYWLDDEVWVPGFEECACVAGIAPARGASTVRVNLHYMGEVGQWRVASDMLMSVGTGRAQGNLSFGRDPCVCEMCRGHLDRCHACARVAHWRRFRATVPKISGTAPSKTFSCKMFAE